jgi:DNA sulfur modification protein DndD
MIFDELTIENFGIYNGRHSINLKPKSQAKPIVLIGALNGSGKTTFLDALQLVLYGKFANCSNRGTQSYNEYLAKTINSYVNAKDGASIELKFSHTRDGSEDEYNLVRSWRSTGKGIKEELEVYVNNEIDIILTEQWYDYVEDFIPSQISSLFFFDGEKIESLADKSMSADLLRTGIHALLGLDLVDRLSNDLASLKNKKSSESANTNDKSELESLLKQIEEKEQERHRLTEVISKNTNELDHLIKNLKNIRKEFKREGGELLDKKDSIKNEKNHIEQRLKDAEQILIEIASGSSPLLLVLDLIQDARDQSETEHSAGVYSELREILIERDSFIINTLKKAVNDYIANDISTYLKEDINERDKHLNANTYLNIEPTVFSVFNDDKIHDLRKSIYTAIERHTHATEELTNIERKLAAIPKPEFLEDIIDRLNFVENEINKKIISIEADKRNRDALQIALDKLNEKRVKKYEKFAENKFSALSTKRLVKHSNYVIDTLKQFRQAVANKHISKLEALILESFKQLIRKESFIERINIDLNTYELSLYRSNGDEVTSERLSAGERQLLAISILWGLAKASGRPLPTIIDTPLGRLDGAHRHNLIDSYFPYSSHQVILLSTDEEIDDKYYEKLHSAIGREYLIEYNEQEKTSEFIEGYFWEFV